MLGNGLPGDFALVAARAHIDWVEAEYTRAGQSLVVRLEHPAQSEHEGVDTRVFRIVAPAGQALDGLVQALARNIEAREGEFRWNQPYEPRRPPRPEPPPPEKRALDVQWLAFRAGIKPAIRISCEAWEVDDVARRFIAGGAYIARGSRFLHDRQVAVIYIAKTAAQAEEMRIIECGTGVRAWVRNRLVHHNLRLGTLLGYPACCVKAYNRRARTWRREHDWYRSARAAWVPRPVPRLNDLLMVEGRSLLSFDPCRYDCPAALELAERIAAAAREADADWLEYADQQLALPIAVDRRGARAHVELEGPSRGGSARIVRAWAPVSTGGDSQKKDLQLAGRLPGRRVSRAGLVEEARSTPPPIVMDFPAYR